MRELHALASIIIVVVSLFWVMAQFVRLLVEAL